MKKTLLLLIILANILHSYNYNEVLLKAQASIFPKILLLDKKLQNKLIDGEIIYTVVYEKNDYFTAREIRDFINKKYSNIIDGFKYKVNLVEFSELSTLTRASAFYVLNSKDQIKKVADIAKKIGVISFAYDVKNLKNGLLLSLMLEKSTVLYLNKRNLYTKNIDFVNIFLQMVRFVDEDNDKS